MGCSNRRMRGCAAVTRAFHTYCAHMCLPLSLHRIYRALRRHAEIVVVVHAKYLHTNLHECLLCLHHINETRQHGTALTSNVCQHPNSSCADKSHRRISLINMAAVEAAQVVSYLQVRLRKATGSFPRGLAHPFQRQSLGAISVFFSHVALFQLRTLNDTPCMNDFAMSKTNHDSTLRTQSEHPDTRTLAGLDLEITGIGKEEASRKLYPFWSIAS
eukprot:1160325-Pelagomonas_calceolata.AAC.8